MKNSLVETSLLLGIVLIITAACSKNAVGYVEVGNHLDKEITDVSWGSAVNLGAIGAEKENGEETRMFGAEYIYLRHDNVVYRSDTTVEVDARTSATYIVEDLDKLIVEKD